MAHLIRYNQNTTQCIRQVFFPPYEIGQWQIVSSSKNRIGLMKQRDARAANNPANYVYEIVSDNHVVKLREAERKLNQQEQQRQWQHRKRQHDEENEQRRRWRWRDPNKKKPGDW